MFAAGASVIFHRDTSQGKGKLPSAFKCILESTYVHEPKPVLDCTGALPQNVQNSKNVILCTRKDTNLSLNQEGEGFPVSSSTAGILGALGWAPQGSPSSSQLPSCFRLQGSCADEHNTLHVYVRASQHSAPEPAGSSVRGKATFSVLIWMN